ncbi:sulfatase-like hydrolase/transferase [Pelagicoccus sp. NFK12]|uniref:Sulfatase-like hydrolase/transferase n=1 Tax=Pelagicoccus enzymogenes TaxID=2773457 RepID=A0A927F5H3_9BACT|nr:sulfatase-like hydrolase/transferase [Pelagicoccus enzymogenes]MBD5778031.1 sulfatase-like hydrolase/transferase [Pelagicoccus enzymogenes]
MKLARRPNILFITSDQQHWNTIGLDNPEVKTPNLDRLAQRGCLFERAYCPNPTCTPTRASIITGMYPSQHGAYSLGTKLDEKHPTLGQALSKNGYKTSLVGKAHFQQLISTPEYPSIESYPILRDLDYWKKYDETFYGFDHVELARNHADECHVGQHYALWMEEKGLTDWAKHFQNAWGDYKFTDFDTSPQYLKWSIPEEYHYNAWIAERTNALMEESARQDEPFFLWASFFDPHPPYIVPEPWDSLYDPAEVTVPQATPGEHDKNPEHFRKTQEENPDFSDWKEEGGNAMHGCSSHLQDKESLAKEIAVYYGMISCMDKYIGQILDKLDALGLADNTLIVFTSDHGHFYGHHGLNAKGPFHYEDLVKVPFIASWPGQIEAGSRSAAIQSLVDLAPTFLAATGTAIPRSMTGLDQSKSWTGQQAPARTHAVVENRHQPTTLHLKTYVDARYKLTTYYNREYGELFDLQADPGELNNLWDSPDHKDLKAALVLKLLHAEMGKEPLPMPRVSMA